MVAGTATGTALNDGNATNRLANFTVAPVTSDISTTFANFPASAPTGTSVTGSVTFTNVGAGTATTPVLAPCN